MSIITLKFKYLTSDDEKTCILKCMKGYTSIYNLTFNFMLKNAKQNVKTYSKDVLKYLNSKNNLVLDTWFRASAHSECGELIKRLSNKNKLDGKIIFGGKELFEKRAKGKISKEEFKIKKLHSIYSVGQAEYYGNAKFILQDKNTVLFKPSRHNHINLKLLNISKQYRKYIKKLLIVQQEKRTPITYRLDLDYIYISFDIIFINKKQNIRKIKNRIFSIDVNPNYIGYSIIDWNKDSFKLIKGGSFCLEKLLKSEAINKRHYEIFNLGHILAKIARQYKCSAFGVEKLSNLSKNHNRGKSYNKLVNNFWNRNLLTSIIKKQCDIYNISYIEILPEYSSFVGNLLYRKLNLPDYCLASIEISRRAYEFYNQYISKTKKKEKNIVFLEKEKVNDLISQSLEELGISETFLDLKDLYYKLKSRKCGYRVLYHKDMVKIEVYNKKALIAYTDYHIYNHEFVIS